MIIETPPVPPEPVPPEPTPPEPVPPAPPAPDSYHAYDAGPAPNTGNAYQAGPVPNTGNAYQAGTAHDWNQSRPEREPARQSSTDRRESAQQTGDMPMKIVLSILAVVNAFLGIASLFRALSLLFSNVGRVLSHPSAAVLARFLFSVLSALSFAVCGIGFVALAGMLILTAFRHNEKNADSFFLGIGGSALAVIAGVLLIALVRLFGRGLFGPHYLENIHALRNILIALVTVGASFGLLLLTGYHLFAAGWNKESLVSAAEGLSPAVTEGLDGFRKSSPAAGGQSSSGAYSAAGAQNAQSSAFRADYAHAESSVRFQDPASIPPPSGTIRLKDDRSFLLYLLLSFITCGIYGYYFIYHLAKDINTACDGDGDLPVGGLGAYIGYSILTCGIYSSCWEFNLVERICYNSPRYGLKMEDNGTTILLWKTLGSTLCGIGWFVAYYRIFKYANQLCAAYNQYNRLT